MAPAAAIRRPTPPPLKSPQAAESTLFVVSDHGFAPYDKLIRPNVILARLGLIATDKSGNAARRSAWSVATGGEVAPEPHGD